MNGSMTKTWLKIIRDAILVQLATGFGGFIIGVSGAKGPKYAQAMAFSNLIFIVAGFFVVGLLNPGGRFSYAFKVAAILWLTNLIMLFFGNTLLTALIQIPFISICLLIGVSLSFLFVRKPPGDKEETGIGLD